MKNRHIAIFTIPRPVHINPMLALVLVLTRRGHRVTYVTSSDYFIPVREVGAEPVGCPVFVAPWDGSDAQQAAQEADEGCVRDFLPLAEHTLRCVTEFYEANPPDLVLFDPISFAGRILAARRGAPAILISPMLDMEEESLHQQIESAEFRESILSLDRAAVQFLRRHGLETSSGFLHKEALNIYLYIQEYQRAGVAFDQRSYYAGRCAAEQPFNQGRNSARTRNRPCALISASTTYPQGPEYYRMCAEALNSMGWHVVLAMGKQSLAGFDALPDSCEVVQGVPLASAMPAADLLICLGGPVTTMEALYHGLPLIALSHGVADAELYAERIATLGCGVHLRGTTVGREDVRAAAQRVTQDASIRRRVEELQWLVRNSPGAEATANQIELFHDRHSGR